MDKSFLNWYTQSLGGIIGLIACMFAYLNGDIAIYGKILKNIDSIGFSGVLASFILIPLCIAITILGFIEAYLENDKLRYINKIVTMLIVIIGIIGAKLYFIIPSIFILFKYGPKFKISRKEANLEVIKENKIVKKNISKQELQKKRQALVKTRIDIAVELLIKGADKKFISDITGLTKQDIERIEQRIK